MHEMSILSNVIDVVLKYAQENNVREVVSVTLVVGELRDVADKLMEHDKDDPEKMDAYLHKIQTSSQHLLSLINDVLDMSKIESSEVTLGREPISLADQVAQIDSIIRSQAESRCQTFTIRVHELTHEHFIGGAMRLRQLHHLSRRSHAA